MFVGVGYGAAIEEAAGAERFAKDCGEAFDFGGGGGRGFHQLAADLGPSAPADTTYKKNSPPKPQAASLMFGRLDELGLSGNELSTRQTKNCYQADAQQEKRPGFRYSSTCLKDRATVGRSNPIRRARRAFV